MENKHKFYNMSDLVGDVVKTLGMINKIQNEQVSQLEIQVKKIKQQFNIE